ncbi:MAG: hypothetical protein LBU16_08780 [Treponema sp.]|jgi:hypothetical protein|nr:hypothetical protein [Treponema sp.]
MKKMCFITALALLCAGAAFGQSGKKNALSVDTAPLLRSLVASSVDSNAEFLGAGLFYELLLGSSFSLGGRVDFISGEYLNGKVSYFAVSGHGRAYPLSQGLAKFYLDTGIGFNTIDMGSNNDKGGLTFALAMGYKHFFNGTIFMEPSIALVYAENFFGSNSVRDPSPLEWTPGLLIGLSF